MTRFPEFRSIAIPPERNLFKKIISSDGMQLLKKQEADSKKDIF